MNESDIRSKISDLQSRLNLNKRNRVRRHINAIRNNIEPSTDGNPTNERRKKTLTNHEIGSVSAPISDSKDVTIRIPRNHIEKLDQNLQEIVGELEDLAEDIRRLDPDELSRSLSELHNGIFGVADNLKVAVLRGGNESRFREYAEIINNANASNYEETIENLEQSLDRIESEFESSRTQLGQLDVPSQETVEEEIHEARSKRAEREFEQMKPHMNMRAIERNFSTGEVVTPEKLANRMDAWSESTAKSCIKNAVTIEKYSERLEKIGEESYKLVE